MGTRVPALVIIGLLGAGIVATKGSISAVRLEDLVPLAAFVCVLPPLVGLMRGSFEIARLAPKIEAVAGYLAGPAERGEAEIPLPALLAPVRWQAVSYAYPVSNTRRGGVVECFDGEWPAGRSHGSLRRERLWEEHAVAPVARHRDADERQDRGRRHGALRDRHRRVAKAGLVSTAASVLSGASNGSHGDRVRRARCVGLGGRADARGARRPRIDSQRHAVTPARRTHRFALRWAAAASRPDACLSKGRADHRARRARREPRC